MAIMIPNRPHAFAPASLEGVMFTALEKLPDEYYVFHSLRLSTVVDNTFHESETDFVVFNKRLGILCLEAKAGQVRYENGYWLYGSGEPMHNGGPFNQAASNKWKLIKYFENHRFTSILEKCKFLHAVWFPSISEIDVRGLRLPTESDKALIMTKEALDDPQQYLERILSTELPNGKQTNLTEQEVNRILREILCPQFNVFPSVTFESDLKKIVFHRMLEEQSGILNFLSEQKTAVINGAAGTGKTMIAVEKAQRHATAGEKVLFLCYNTQLKSYLSENYAHENIDYYTISGLACKLCNTTTPNYEKMKSVLEDMYVFDNFPYMHIVIDEGQDFGIDAVEETGIIDVLKSIITDIKPDSASFYIFYDKLQLVQSRKIPQYISDADCKLTLYRNCRNTENIATTSLAPITERKPKLIDGCVKGVPAKLHFCDSDETAHERLDLIIDTLKGQGVKDIVILTCKTESTSILCDFVSNSIYRNKYRFSTCRKFKGLEADAVILVDVTPELFEAENSLIYYVGTSRARLWLDIITTMDNEACTDVLQSVFEKRGHVKNPQRELAASINAIPTK